MWPELCRVGPVTLHTYGAMMALAFVLAIALARRAARSAARGTSSPARIVPAQSAARQARQRLPMDGAAVTDWAVWAMCGGIVGGRLLYVLLNAREYLAHPLEIVALWHGGLIWYGGLAGGAAATWWWLRRRGSGFLPVADQLIPFVALGHAVGRIGCFANGCCGGVPTTAWWGVTFPASTEPVVPTQLLESAALALLYVLLRALQRPAMLQAPGRIFGAYLTGYGLIRWVVEGWRTNEQVWFGWTLSQILSVALITAGLMLLLRQTVSDTFKRKSV